MSRYEMKIRDAIKECETFLASADALLDKSYRDINDSFDKHQESGGKTFHSDNASFYMQGTALSGELKRRSMDLTRALVELRKP